MASHPAISVHLAEIASWKALRTNERQAVLAALHRLDVLSARVAELEGALREIDERAAEAINTALAKKQGGLADEFVWIADRAHEALRESS